MRWQALTSSQDHQTNLAFLILSVFVNVRPTLAPHELFERTRLSFIRWPINAVRIAFV